MRIYKIIVAGGMLLSATLLPFALTTPASAASLLCPAITENLNDLADGVSSTTMQDLIRRIAVGTCTPNGEPASSGTPQSIITRNVSAPMPDYDYYCYPD